VGAATTLKHQPGILSQATREGLDDGPAGRDRPCQGLGLATAVLLTGPGPGWGQAGAAVRVHPERPLIERSACCQLLNFDFELSVLGPDTLTVTRIDLSVLNPSGRLVAQRHVSGNGMIPSIATVPNTRLLPGRTTMIYNPLYSFEGAIPIHEMRYTFTLRGRSGVQRAEVMVRPVAYQGKTDLILPLTGRVMVLDGHDFYSHHRRLDLSVLVPLGLLRRHFNRYAYDFSLVDDRDRLSRTGGGSNEDWVGYGATVLAPGDGVVRDAVNDAKEHILPHDQWDDEAGMQKPRSIPGNFVVIDHENGEVSFLAHLKQGSVVVKPGDRVRRGQVIGRMGLSGDSDETPHIHYQLMDAADFRDADGLPSYFSGFVRAGRAGRQVELRAQVDTGDILEVPPPAR
jgi:Peptidase family M23